MELTAPTVVSLFAGCGGSSLGYRWAGYRCPAAVENDANAVETYRLNFPETPVLERDIRTVTGAELLGIAGLGVGGLDVLDGSPPCQSFSTAGKRRVNDPRADLFMEYVRLLRELQPRAFIAENVSGLVKGTAIGHFKAIMRAMKDSGYRVSCRLLNAMYYGVPQSRERLIFVGVRDDLDIKPSHPKPQTRVITLREALTGVRNDESDVIESCYPVTTLSHRLLERMGPWEGGHQYHPRGAMFGLRRLAWDRPSRTVLREDGGGASCQCCHPEETRRLTIPEIKRVASFPDDFQLLGSVGERWARIGNSVPPKLMQAVAAHVRAEVLERAGVTT